MISSAQTQHRQQTADFLGTDRHAELLCHTKQSHLVISFPQPYFIAIRDEMFTGT
jgi:tRNA pseudouridine-54 N-methylase